MNICRKAGRLMDVTITGLAWLSGILMLFSLVSVCVDVVMRYFFNRPSGWVLQISEYILLYIPFLSAAYVLKADGHIRVDILLNAMSRKTGALLNTMTSILGAGVLLVLAYYGFAATYDFYLRQVPTLKYLKIPEYLIIIVIPVGCLLFGLQSIRQATGYFKEYRAQKLEKQLRH